MRNWRAYWVAGVCIAGATCAAIDSSAIAQVYSLDWGGNLYKAINLEGPGLSTGRVDAASNRRYNSMTYDATTGLFLSMSGVQDFAGPSLFVWFTASGAVQRTLPALVSGAPTNDYAMGIAFGPGGLLFATMYQDRSIFRVDTQTGEMTALQTFPRFPLDIAISPQGELFESSFIERGVFPAQFSRSMFNPTTGLFENRQLLPMQDSPGGRGYQAIALLPDGSLIGNGWPEIRRLNPIDLTELPISQFGDVPRDIRGMVVIPSQGTLATAIPFILCAQRDRRRAR